jgi:glutamate racemase
VFDSGVGGLSVLRELRATLPAEDVIYYADRAFCPYGQRTAEQILERAVAIVGAFVAWGAKLVVVACNTASIVALPTLRSLFPSLPIVGTVPAVKPAAALSRSGRIAVLATPRTVGGAMFAKLVGDHCATVEVVPIPAPGLVELVEAGQTDGPTVERALRPLLAPLPERGVDALVLGCTHYPFLSGAIRRLAGPDVAVLDGSAAVARRARDVLDRADGRELDRAHPGTIALLTSAEPAAVGALASRLLDTPVSATCRPV